MGLPVTEAQWSGLLESRERFIDESHQLAKKVTQLWVDDVDAMQRMMDSREFREGSWPDGEKFLDLSLARSFVAQEHQVIWPA